MPSHHICGSFAAEVPAPHLSMKRANVVSEFPAHLGKNEGDDLRRFVPGYKITFTQPDERFIDKRSVLGAFSPQYLPGHSAQFRVVARQ